MSESLSSVKPYLLRAHHEWMVHNGLTPHLVVDADVEGVQVPPEHVKDGAITLNIAPQAVHGLLMGNDAVEFNARFGGVSRHLFVPMAAIVGLMARENGMALTFPPDPPAEIKETSGTAGDDDNGSPEPEPPGPGTGKRARPSLKIVR